ncbi:MAG: LUD domain-containing protein [Verrucomicrobia bacterium]|nr:LUD domain-containing protein [Verrucomicrobiota bacterium]
MSERENILARVKEALTVAAPLPGSHHGAHAEPASLPTQEDHRRVLPLVGESFEERVALFAKNSDELRSDFKLLIDQSELVAALNKLRAAEGWTRVASHKGSLTDAACQALGLPVLLTDAGFDKTELEKCPVGISECDALVAQTGSVLVTSRSAGGRALSVLPPHHVVLARRGQLVPGLPEAFALVKQKYGADYPSMISFITGPSRTGDIERILVLGAHGPKKLTILCF